VATSTTRIRLRVLVLFVWFVVGVFVLSAYTWSHYEAPAHTQRTFPQLGRDIMFCLTVGDSATPAGLPESPTAPAGVRTSPIDCDRYS
jgi:hypothetical protein